MNNVNDAKLASLVCTNSIHHRLDQAPHHHGPQPFRWTRSGGTHVLGGPAGSVFRWTEQAGFELVGDLSSINDSALGIPADGQVVVGAKEREAFRWTSQDGTKALRPSGVGGSTTAVDVSADGSTIVGDISGSISFRWTADRGMLPLGPATPAGPHTIAPLFSYALAMPGLGEAVVGSGNGTMAYLWTEAFGLESLQLVLANRFGLGSELAGWQLEEATDISPDGRAIVGKGRSPSGQIQAWLVQLDRPIFIPEPCTAGLVAVGLGVLASVRRRRRDLEAPSSV